MKINGPYKAARKVVIAVVGFSLILIGIALLVLPGPGLLVIAGGLAVLAIEFTWAERYLESAKAKMKNITDKAREKTRDKNT